MASEWLRTTLGAIAKFYSGGTPSKQNDTFWRGSIPWISATSLKTSRISDSDLRITQDGLQAGSRLALKNDVLLLVRGSALHQGIPVGIATCDVAFNQDIKALRAQAGVDPHFLFYQLWGRRSELLGMVEFTGIGAGKLDTIKLQSLTVDLPDLDGQRKIAAIGRFLDDRIDHNRALAANLEAIARRLFKSWFVDFDPVCAKSAGDKPAGLADDLAALFPDRFVESELGDAPDGWKLGKVSDFSTNVRVGCIPSQFSSEDFYVGLEHFDRRCLTLWNGGSGSEATSNKNRFEKGDLLFGKLRPYFHKVAIAPTAGICSTDILVIRCTDSAYREFMYLSLFQDEVIQFVSDASGGTRMPRTNWETLAGYDCVVPPQPVAYAFGEIVAPMIETMMQCVSENDALTKIRDLLLPRLISGKLRVSDAATFIEEAIA